MDVPKRDGDFAVNSSFKMDIFAVSIGKSAFEHIALVYHFQIPFIQFNTTKTTGFS